MKGIVVCCEGEKSLERAFTQLKSKKTKSSKRKTVISLISELFATRHELKFVNERG